MAGFGGLGAEEEPEGGLLPLHLQLWYGSVTLLALFFYSFTGGVTQKRALDTEIAGLYWHFVDIVWIVIFVAVYLLEYII